jgi:16S rRNA (uracil1498-N3)-methyltransferase
MGPEAGGCPPERWPADAESSAHVFVESAAALTDGLDVIGEDGHHLARVLRLRTGEAVTVADGSGLWRPYRIAGIGPAGATGAGSGGAAVHLAAAGPAEREPELTPGLAVAFALTKGDKPELVVQKLTELGVDRIVPVVAERSVARPDPARAAAAAERWRRIAREAACQCRRARLPVVEDLRPLAELAGHPAIVAERGGGPADGLGVPAGGDVLVVVGPEGGLSGAEVEALAPWARLGLGPYVLRAETAAVAAATVLAAIRHPVRT